MTDEDIVNDCAEAAHEAWLEEKRNRLAIHNPRVPPWDLTWFAENGDNQLVPWDTLSDHIREFDRIVVRAMLGVLRERGYLRD